MRLAKYIIIVLILPSVILHAQAKSLVQLLENWPAGCDTTGKHWVVYNIYKAQTHYVTESSVASATETTYWMAQIGNFNGGVTPWFPGDTLMTIGSIDTAYIHNQGTYGENIDHTGFYWLFSDTIHASTPEAWLPSDTVRVIPKPIVSQTGPGAGADDTIWVKIPNPMETDTLDPIDYSVLGYWLVADSTGAGTPNALNDGVKILEIGFIPVQGDTGDTTVHWMLESDGFEGWSTWTTYFAYKIVARPDTVGAPSDTMGYSTYYWSQNSDAIDVYQNVIGIEENTQPRIQQIMLQALPNLFTDNTRIVFSITKPTLVKLVVYNTSGQIIRTLVNDVKPAGEHHVGFDGTDTQGIELPAGIYFYQMQTPEEQLTGRLTKLR